MPEAVVTCKVSLCCPGQKCASFATIKSSLIFFLNDLDNFLINFDMEELVSVSSVPPSYQTEHRRQTAPQKCVQLLKRVRCRAKQLQSGIFQPTSSDAKVLQKAFYRKSC